MTSTSNGAADVRKIVTWEWLQRTVAIIGIVCLPLLGFVITEAVDTVAFKATTQAALLETDEHTDKLQATVERIDRAIEQLKQFAAKTSENRFTNNDGTALMERIHAIETKQAERYAELRDLIQTEAKDPPEWFERKVDAIGIKVDSLATQMSTLSAEMARLREP